MAIEFRDGVNIITYHDNRIDITIDKDDIAVITGGWLTVEDLEQILSKMKELQSEVMK